MKKRILYPVIVAVLVLACACFALVGCSSSSSNEGDFIGVWYAISAYYNGTTYTVGDDSGVLSDPDAMILAIYDDNTCDFTSNGYTKSGTWKIKGSALNMTISDSTTSVYYSANTLSLKSGKYTYTLSKERSTGVQTTTLKSTLTKNSSEEYTDGYVKITDVSFTTGKNTTYGYYAKITCTVENISQEFSSVSIDFSVYTDDGYNLGSVTDEITHFCNGDLWSFSGTLYCTNSSTYKNVYITEVL